MIINVNLGSALFAFAIFSGTAYLLDPLFHNLGYFLLTGIPALHNLWTALYSFPVIALSRYNNTVVTGSLAIAVLFIIPVFPFSRFFVTYYRAHIDPVLQKIKLVQLIKGSKFYMAYEKIKRLGI